ncbi:type I restriction endonuclease [Glycomyces sp. L485]|uniref:type I restriction endonuclease n=1 Tax=Glycomyces sp. L485 TaxID=2909235 RepID=UPI001F4A82C0|nr:type I restriction endonuclease [Glycomyces sp. L485]MCH7231523.1 type I restriction endonuclease [Glycomyces sp. L485]
MEFNERIAALITKVRNQRDMVQTEEGAKNAFIMPFISTILGYDVFDPLEVVPEFTADVGLKKGEKVDYAILHGGEVQILIECKRSNGQLTAEHASQLFRYFAVTNARIAILTNGEVYQFYTDLDAPNRMDAKPFLVLDFHDIDETLLPELRKLTKESFDLESIISAAEELKYIGQIKRTLAAQFKEPESEWVKFLTTRVYDGSFTQRVREQFTPLVAKAATQFLNDQVNSRLQTALGSGFAAPSEPETAESSADEPSDDEGTDRESDVETTLEEIGGYQIVKAIACSEVKPHRIIHRDAKSYFAILLDDNNRKPIARLHFNGKSKKYLGTFDADKNERRHLIDSLDDIYLYSDSIREAVQRYKD